MKEPTIYLNNASCYFVLSRQGFQTGGSILLAAAFLVNAYLVFRFPLYAFAAPAVFTAIWEQDMEKMFAQHTAASEEN